MSYYAEKLNSTKLFQVYNTSIPRVLEYLNAEIEYIKTYLSGTERVLEIGTGYGRILKQLSPYTKSCVGIDISKDSIDLSESYLRECTNCTTKVMDAHNLCFHEEFDIVLCLQNGLSAMKGEANNLINQSLRVLHPGGKAFFSTYSNKFWEHRLMWFREQANKGLLGEIDESQTRDGVIICKDGFRADTFSSTQLEMLGKQSGFPYHIHEVDESSLFLIIEKID